MSVNWKHILVFAAAMCAVIYLSIPAGDALAEPARERGDSRNDPPPAAIHSEKADDPRKEEALPETDDPGPAPADLDELLDDPDSAPGILILGIEAAYRSGNFASLAGLFSRLRSAGGPDIDAVVYDLLENAGKTAGASPAGPEDGFAAIQTLAGLAWAAARDGNGPEAAMAADLALPRLEADDFIDGLGLMEALLFLAGVNGADERALRLNQADGLAGALAAGPLGHSRWFLLLSADLRQRQGRVGEAERLWAGLAREFPEDAAGWLGLGGLAAARGDGKTAEEAFARLAAMDGKLDAGEVVGAIDICIAMNDFFRKLEAGLADVWLRRANDLYQRRRNFFPDSELENVTLESDLLERMGEWDESFALWQKISRLRPDRAEVKLGLARAALGRGDADLSWEYLIQANRLGIVGLDLELQMARQLLEAVDAIPAGDPRRAGRSRLAFDFAEGRLRRGWEPELAEAMIRLALAENDLAKAREILSRFGADASPEMRAALARREAEESSPDSGEFPGLELSIPAADGRPERTLAAFGQARRRWPDIEARLTGDALAAIADAYAERHSAPLARRFYRLSLEKAPANRRGSLGLARLLRRDGNLGGAVRQLRAYVEANPDDPRGWLELADCRFDANQGGRREYLRVVELTNPGPRGDLPRDLAAARAAALRRLGREAEALPLLRDAIGDPIEDPDAACDYAQALMELRRYDEAGRVLRDTIRLFPRQIRAYRLESAILIRQRRYALAAARLREARRWAPTGREAGNGRPSAGGR
ncbi:MAG: tetratricopeptide repeat protein [Planctomycetota bacterium]|nr:tetratricopeptide repeat protein [Planctomycetota bacterium]